MEVKVTQKEAKVAIMKEFKLDLYFLILHFEDFNDGYVNKANLKLLENILENLRKNKNHVLLYLQDSKRELLYELIEQLHRFTWHYRANLEQGKYNFRANLDFLQYLTFDLYKHLLENCKYYFEDMC